MNQTEMLRFLDQFNISTKQTAITLYKDKELLDDLFGDYEDPNLKSIDSIIEDIKSDIEMFLINPIEFQSALNYINIRLAFIMHRTERSKFGRT